MSIQQLRQLAWFLLLVVTSVVVLAQLASGAPGGQRDPRPLGAKRARDDARARAPHSGAKRLRSTAAAAAAGAVAIRTALAPDRPERAAASGRGRSCSLAVARAA